MASLDEYLAQAQALLPPGPVWTRDKDANLTKLLASFAAIFAAIDARAEQLANESVPSNAMELLADWERVCGLPDDCSAYDISLTVEERQNNIVNLLSSNSPPTVDFFQMIAERMGYEVIIEQLEPFTCGLSRCGDRLNGGENVRSNIMIFLIKGSRVAYFRAGSARCGDSLGAIRYATDLECKLNKIKPAHVKLIFGYE